MLRLLSTRYVFAIAICIASILATSAHAQFATAQSAYRFTIASDYMVLSIYSRTRLFGHTSSWFNKSQNVIVGRVLGINEIELGVYDGSAENAAREEFSKPGCVRNLFHVSDVCFARFLDAIALGKSIAPLRRYTLKAGGAKDSGAWLAANDNADNYQSFSFYQDYELDSAEAQLRGLTQRYFRPRDLLARGGELPKSLESSIVHFYAGLPSAFVPFKTQFCDKTGARLTDIIKKAGKWDVSVEPEVEQHFGVFLKSHSSREYFYQSGSWWKAFFDVSFRHEDNSGNCSGASVYLYDTVVCGAPVNDDPDRSRPECYRRLPPDSRAEVDLRDRLMRALIRAFGASD